MSQVDVTFAQAIGTMLVSKRIKDAMGYPKALPCWDRFRDDVLFWCPLAHVHVLKEHAIAPDGTVDRSVKCPKEGCAFDEFVLLESWEKT